MRCLTVLQPATYISISPSIIQCSGARWKRSAFPPSLVRYQARLGHATFGRPGRRKHPDGKDVAVTDSVLSQTDGAVATITINRPEARNALTAETKVALLAALRAAGADDNVRAVILTGAGQAFSAGQDLREHAQRLQEGGAVALDTVREHYNPMIEAIATMPKPVIAALPGVAAGAGASLAFACDFRIAAERASLVLAFSAGRPRR